MSVHAALNKANEGSYLASVTLLGVNGELKRLFGAVSPVTSYPMRQTALRWQSASLPPANRQASSFALRTASMKRSVPSRNCTPRTRMGVNLWTPVFRGGGPFGPGPLRRLYSWGRWVKGDRQPPPPLPYITTAGIGRWVVALYSATWPPRQPTG